MADQVGAAVLALYQHPDPQVKKQADSWLQQFQKSKEAWKICQTLLTSEVLEIQFYACTTLVLKVRSEWEQLPEEERSSLLQCTVSLFAKISHPLILPKLSSLLASIVIRQDPKFLPNLLKDIIQNFAEAKVILFSVLGYLVEETELAVFSLRKREDIKKALLQFLDQVMLLITSTFKSQDQNLVSKQAAMKCLEQWTRSWFVGQPTLFEMIINALANSQLSSSAVDVLLEMLQKPTKFTNASALKNRLAFEQENDTLVASIIAKFVTLRQPYYEAKNNGNTDYCKGLALVARGEGQVKFLTEGGPEAMSLLLFIMDCVSHPDKSILCKLHLYNADAQDVAAICLSVMGLLETSLGPHQRPKFLDVYHKLLQILVQQCSYPPDLGTEEDDPELEDFLAFREEASVVYPSILRMLGSNFVQLLISGLESNLSEQQWPTFESILHAVSSVLLQISEEDKSRVVPTLLALIFKFPVEPHVTAISLHILGVCSPWISQNHQYVGPSVTYIVKLMSSTDKKVVAASVRSFHQICKCCAPTLVSGVNDLLGIGSQLSLKFNDKQLLLESLLLVVNHLPVDKVHSTLPQLTVDRSARVSRTSIPALWQHYKTFCLLHLQYPFYVSLKDCLSNNKDREKELSESLKLLAAGLCLPSQKTITADSPIIAPKIIQVVGPLLQKWQSNPEITESACEVYIELIKIEKGQYAPYLPVTITSVLEVYRACSSPCCLGVLSTVIGTGLDVALKVAAEKTFQIMQAGIAQHPDVVEAFFELMTKVMEFRSHLLFSSGTLLVTIVQLSIACLPLEDQQASKRIVSFFEKLLFGPAAKSQQFAPYVTNVLQSQGEQLVVSILRTLATSTQCRALIQSDLLFNLGSPQAVYNWVGNVLSANVFDKLTNEDKTSFLRVLFALKDKRKFKSLIKDFNQVCNGLAHADVFLSYEL